MSLYSAIIALTPVLYWRLDEAAGSTTVLDSAGGAFNGAVTGDIGLGAYGPEIGRTAARIFTSGLIASPAWGATTWSTFTLQFLASVPVTGAVGTGVPVIGLGDPANPNNKLRVSYQSSTANTGNFTLRAGLGPNISSVIPFATPNWHLYTWVYNTATANITPYIDGIVQTAVSTTPSPAPIGSDKWFIESTTPIVVSDMAVWTRALTQAEITTVGTQLQTWPYAVPINVPLSTGIQEPVTIAPDDTVTQQILANTQTMLPQSAQIPAINTTVQEIQTEQDAQTPVINATHTDTQNIINTLFPALETPLNYIQSTVTDILNGITTTITTAAGSVGQTLGDFFSVHSKDQFGLFSVTGGPTCARISWTAGDTAYWGLTVKITTWPSEWTFTTPDDGWSIRDLAVLTILIDDEVQRRWGIHQKEFTVNPLPGTFPIGVAGVGVPVTPPSYTIVVDWAGGVCGELLLHYLP